jgi:thiol-disulfide isomerase/thioredoxin
MSGDPAHQVITNDRGEFVIGSIPRQTIDGKPMKAFVVVTKEGYAGVDSQSITLLSNDEGKPPALEPLRLEPGMSLSGTVVDPDGRPAIGVWVKVQGSYALRQQFARTDEKGHFRVKNLPRGVVSLYFEYDKLFQMGKYFAEADPKANTIEVRLRSVDEALAASKNRPAKRAPSLELGKPAPDWKVATWTDGKARSLADYRGKVVILDFWGIWCSACINAMPDMERLKQKFEPRDVVFLSIHTRGEEIGKIRRFLEFKKLSAISALDADDGQHTNEYNGVTADRYGVQGYPALAIIDRQGNLAFHTGIGKKEGVAAMKAMGKEMGLSESTMTEADFHRLWEAYFSREIEKLLDRR